MLLPLSMLSSWDTCFTFHRCPLSPPWGHILKADTELSPLCQGLDFGVELNWVLLPANPPPPTQHVPAWD